MKEKKHLYGRAKDNVKEYKYSGGVRSQSVKPKISGLVKKPRGPKRK